MPLPICKTEMPLQYGCDVKSLNTESLQNKESKMLRNWMSLNDERNWMLLAP